MAIDTEFLEQRKKCMDLHKETLKAQEEELNALRFLRKNCNHPDEYIAEAPADKRDFPGYPPFRACERCGYYELDRGTGYNLLKDKKVHPATFGFGCLSDLHLIELR